MYTDRPGNRLTTVQVIEVQLPLPLPGMGIEPKVTVRRVRGTPKKTGLAKTKDSRKGA